MNKYPMFFKANLDSRQGIQTSWETKALSQSQGVSMAIPPEFDGPGNGLGVSKFKMPIES